MVCHAYRRHLRIRSSSAFRFEWNGEWRAGRVGESSDQSERITNANRPGLNDRRIGADTNFVVPCRSLKYPGILGEIRLGERRHDASETRPSYMNADFGSDSDHFIDPVVLDKSFSITGVN